MKKEKLEQRLQEVTVASNDVDIFSFSDCSRADIAFWVSAHMDELSTILVEKALSFLNSHDRSQNIPAHIQNYCREDWQKLRRTRLGPLRFYRPVPLIVALATQYDGISCHALLFQSDYLPRISRRESSFLHSMDRLKPADQRSISMMLRNGYEELHDIQYILKLRLAEVATEAGLDLSEMVSASYPAHAYRKKMTAFVSDLSNFWAKPRDGMKESIDYMGTPLFLHTLYMICIAYTVSADRLLLQDFSRTAVDLDGSPLTDDQRHYLSLFQCASLHTQELAIQELILKKGISQKN